MNTMKKTAAGAVLGGALLAAGGLGLAHAAPPVAPQAVVNDGKVNVTVTVDNQEIGVLQNVSLANAQALAASACANAGVTEQALQALDTDGTPLPTQCVGLAGGPTFTFAQNTGNTENAPGQNRNQPMSPTSPTSPTPSS